MLRSPNARGTTDPLQPPARRDTPLGNSGVDSVAALWHCGTGIVKPGEVELAVRERLAAQQDPGDLAPGQQSAL